MSWRKALLMYATIALGMVIWVVVAQGSSRPSIRVQGTCRSAPNGGGLVVTGSGFNAGWMFRVRIWYPSGKAYPLGIFAVGRVDDEGQVVIDVNCSKGQYGGPEMAGRYRIEITQYQPVSPRAISHFTINP